MKVSFAKKNKESVSSYVGAGLPADLLLGPRALVVAERLDSRQHEYQ